jgi:hypothetical protein
MSVMSCQTNQVKSVRSYLRFDILDRHDEGWAHWHWALTGLTLRLRLDSLKDSWTLDSLLSWNLTLACLHHDLADKGCGLVGTSASLTLSVWVKSQIHDGNCDSVLAGMAQFASSSSTLRLFDKRMEALSFLQVTVWNVWFHISTTPFEFEFKIPTHSNPIGVKCWH